MGKIISPIEFVEIITNPVIFLAGPIRGAPKWHEEAIKYLFSQEENLTIVSPSRINRTKIPSEKFSRQREWELYYLDLASKKGAIMFWLPGETEHKCEKSYGAMTRIELGESFVKYSKDNSFRFCIGSDGKFSELDTIKVDLEEYVPGKRIFTTLKETCDEALKIARQ